MTAAWQAGRRRPCHRPSAGVKCGRLRAADGSDRLKPWKAVDQLGVGHAVECLRQPVARRRLSVSAVSAPPAGALRIRDARIPSPLTRASRADRRRRPPAWVPSVKAVLTRRAPAAARSHYGRVEGDGMLAVREPSAAA